MAFAEAANSSLTINDVATQGSAAKMKQLSQGFSIRRLVRW